MNKLTVKELVEIFKKTKFKCINGDVECCREFLRAWDKTSFKKKYQVPMPNLVTMITNIDLLGEKLLDKEEAQEIAHYLIKKEVIYCHSYMDRIERGKAEYFKKEENPAATPRIREHTKLTRRWKGKITSIDIVQSYLGTKVTYKFIKENKGQNHHSKFKWLRKNYPKFIEQMKVDFPKKSFIME